MGVTLSIIIVTYNPGEVVMECLRTVTAAIAHIDAEIMVIDNGSSDGMIERIERDFSHVQVIRLSENRGFAAANNIGLARAAGEYLLLLNPDVWVRVDDFRAMLRDMDALPRAGILGPRTLDARGRVAITAHPPLTAVTILWQFWRLDVFFPYRVHAQYHRAAETTTVPFRVAWVQGHCLLIRRAVYTQIGGLDEGPFLFAEEPDYSERAAAAGWETWFTPSAQVIHYESSAVSQYPYLKMLHLHISVLYYFRKRGLRGTVWVLKAGFVIELGLKYIVRLAQIALRRPQPATGIAAKVQAYPAVIAAIVRY